MIKGVTGLSPIQERFFGQGGPAHHYNQSILLEVAGVVEVERLRRCLDRLVRQHDALRMVYRQVGGQWEGEMLGEEQGYGWEELTVPPGEDTAGWQAVQCDRIQSGLDLARGPLFRVCLLRGAGADQLLLVAHHLVVDGLSWRILLEDLSSMYGGMEELPQKTDSWLYWQERQRQYAGSAELLGQEGYWKGMGLGKIAALPVDHPGGRNWQADAVAEGWSLEEGETGLLLGWCYRGWRTEINDILVTGLSVALGEQWGLSVIGLQLEGHGREEIGAGVEVSRTVGWFTTVYPVVVEVPAGATLVETLIGVKEVLHRVPNKGHGYGVLKYMLGREYGQEPGVTFNYLGDFGRGVESGVGRSVFGYSGGYRGREVSGERERDSELEVTGLVVGGRL